MSKSEQGTKRILVVDDSATICMVVKNAINSVIDYPVDSARSLEACKVLLAEHRKHYQLAVVDLSLPDAKDGEAVDLVLSFGIATIVLTGSLDSDTHARISAKPIVDYVTKQSPGSIAIVQKSVAHTLRNMKSKVLIVEKNSTFRDYLIKTLLNQRLEVIEAESVVIALAKMEQFSDIAVVVAGYHAQDLDAIDLCMKLRTNLPSSKLAIIGITKAANDFSGVRFFKAGADDIIHKPFLVEEFVSRINARLDYLDSLRIIQEQADRDYLTKLHNRRYLYEIGNTLFSNAKRGNMQIMVAMLDIDFFKRINDTHGHDVGDLAIVAVAQTIQHSFRTTDIVARMGGEEFCVVAMNNHSPQETMERLRKTIEALAIPISDTESLHLTVSIGLTINVLNTLDEMITLSDAGLYKAKQGGRNQVVQL